MRFRQPASLAGHRADEFVQESVSSMDVRPIRTSASTLVPDREQCSDRRFRHGVIFTYQKRTYVTTNV